MSVNSDGYVQLGGDIRNIYIIIIFFSQSIYAQCENENGDSFESGITRDMSCDGHDIDSFLHFVCDSIYNRLIQKNVHQCSYYYDSMDENDSINISSMFINFQNNEEINSNVYGILDYSNNRIIMEEEYWDNCDNEQVDFKKGWGTYINNLDPVHPLLSIQANHPLYDGSTGMMAAKLYEATGAKWLAIAGAHRYALVDGTTHCDADTINCGADVARDHFVIGADTTWYVTAFQLFHEATSNDNSVSVSLHGYEQDEDHTDDFPNTGVVISNGCDENGAIISPSDLLLSINYYLNQLDIWDDNECGYEVGSVIVADAFDKYKNLKACKNPQGKFTNTNNFSDEWIHIEIEECIRLNIDLVDSIINAISTSFDFPQIFGCTDPNATNYDETANVDDGCCEYVEDCPPDYMIVAGYCVSIYDYNILQNFLDLNPESQTLPDGTGIPNSASECINEEWWYNGRLIEISFEHKNLTSIIPLEFGELDSLEILSLTNNELTGGIPNNLMNLNNLKILKLNSNELSSTIPENIGALSKLDTLQLSDNNLTGEIPQSITGIDSLSYLALNNNNLTGPIPESIGFIHKLEYLYLDDNQLTGEIPQSIGNLENIKRLYLNTNYLTDCIPENICTIYDNNENAVVMLDNNQLCPSYPECIPENHLGAQDSSDCDGGCGSEYVYDCTHPNATNYDEAANVDDDSCEYETVQIGHQVWMQENLKTTHYRNGDAISTGLDNSAWSTTIDGAYAVYDDDSANAEEYGNLYNWYAVDDNRGICPEGFHVPNDDEFTGLTDYLGGESVAGGKMKSTGTIEYGDGLWYTPNTGATNESGFTALPGGSRGEIEGNFNNINNDCYFWYSNEYESENNKAWYNLLIYDINAISETTGKKKNGFSIRCLSDETQTTTLLVPDNFATIQEAIDYSIDGDTILVSAGPYYENINFNGKNIALIGEDRETTIIDGGQNGKVIKVHTGGLSSLRTIHTFTIQNGLSDIDNPDESYRGGGISIDNNSSLFIDNCIITNNTAHDGAGVSVLNESLVHISNSIISNNYASDDGGGLYLRWNSSIEINYSLIVDNVAVYAGGAICQGSEFEETCSLTMTNVTVQNNIGPYLNSDGIMIRSGELNILNSIVNEDYNFIYSDNVNHNIEYTLNHSGWVGEGNIDDDPLFTDPENGDFTLKAGSPCKDAGDPDLDNDGIDFDGPDDILGNEDDDTDDQDPDGTRLDMGAYPTYQDCTDTEACNYNPEANTENGTCNLPDCAGECNGEETGNNYEDDCGTCDDEPANDCIDYSLELNAGNNLISFNVIPSDNSVENVLSSLGGTADALIGEGIAAVNSGSGWIGGLTTILYVDGYWLQVNQSATLNLTGIPISPGQTYTLQSGNNLISYPLADCWSIEEVLPDDIEVCIDAIIGAGIMALNTGNDWQGSLGVLCPDKGYWFRNLCDEITFTFDEPTSLARREVLSPSPRPYNQSSQQAFYFIETIVDIDIGDWVLAYNGDMVIGARQWTGDIIDVPAMGDDGSTFTSGYIKSGTAPQFKLLQGDKLTDLTGEVSTWSDNQIFMVKSLMPLPESFSLSAAYPNPFNPTTKLNFSIPVDSEVSLSVYNLQGREVATLISRNMHAGYHSVVWNADANSSGLYFVKMVSGEYISTQKLMLLK